MSYMYIYLKILEDVVNPRIKIDFLSSWWDVCATDYQWGIVFLLDTIIQVTCSFCFSTLSRCMFDCILHKDCDTIRWPSSSGVFIFMLAMDILIFWHWLVKFYHTSFIVSNTNHKSYLENGFLFYQVQVYFPFPGYSRRVHSNCSQCSGSFHIDSNYEMF